ncbi:MAG: formylglycine-generating enzyme family protein [Woeseiaceae bacterium]|nr:formylglycine-generating enzyme family protein [Woeseiaceae bacterium]
MAVTNELARLYREYYANRLSLADYRYQRGMLLDSLVAEEFPPDVESEEDITISRGEPETAAPEPAPEPPKESRGTRWPMVAAVIVVLFGGTVYVVTTQLDQSGDVPQPAASDSAPAVAAPDVEPLTAPDIYVPPDVGQRLVETFLADDDWSIESLQRFLDAWVSLPASDRIVAKGAVWFEPLADRLEYEIDEAVEFASAPDSDVQLQQLYATAVGLGLTELAPDNWKPGLAARSVPQQEAAEARSPSVSPVAEEPIVDQTIVDEGGANELTANETIADESIVDEIIADETMDEETMVDEAIVDEAVVEGAVDSQPEQAAVDVGDPVDPAGAVDAAARIVPLENEDACRAEQLQTRRRSCFDLLVSGGQGPSMRVIPSGAVADVTVDTPFAISTMEVSRSEFLAFCEATGTECPADPWPGENMPMVNVSRADAQAYSDWLSAETGYAYRLPTEAEWEYAARGGSTTDYPFGGQITAGLARYSSITTYDSPLPREDRTTQRNEFGLWHVIGNVREWVDSSAAGGEGVTRGGSYADDADGLRISLRQPMSASERDAMTGFRVVREL